MFSRVVSAFTIWIGVVAGPTARAILDHIFVPQQASSAAADVPQRDSADAQ
ncbi:hypothetical protein [Klebsiella pneumoniae]|uniref:hypothetical protein n=1 Tax=Klebsiella pneumoniae TaxID=573 RepID=UPI00140389D9|nr:hypothetical protein [Klebsiella pneumoniae]